MKKNISHFTYHKDKNYAQITLYDKITGKSLPTIIFKGTLEECVNEHGRLQYEYYAQYPKLLPQSIYLSPNSNKTFFRVAFLIPLKPKKVFHLGTFITVQEAYKAKRDFISANL